MRGIWWCDLLVRGTTPRTLGKLVKDAEPIDVEGLTPYMWERGVMLMTWAPPVWGKAKYEVQPLYEEAQPRMYGEKVSWVAEMPSGRLEMHTLSRVG